jgi:lipoprotein-anchoring transpeptidase ErfK/SrfK
MATGELRVRIQINLSEKTLKLFQNEKVIFESEVVSGCDDSGTPTGKYKSGEWQEGKINTKHSGDKSWAQDPWGNPYGPYFLKIHRLDGSYTQLGIHGTRGPGWAVIATPPVPQSILKWFVGVERSKYYYCSHGCIRIPNKDIIKLFNLTLLEARKIGSIAIELRRSNEK